VKKLVEEIIRSKAAGSVNMCVNKSGDNVFLKVYTNMRTEAGRWLYLGIHFWGGHGKLGGWLLRL
jgi:hypothetical protein